MANNHAAMKQAALDYVSHGWPVFPLRPGSKKPATEHGFKDATTDEDQIKSWWDEGPAYNIGVPTGADTFDAIDLDGPHAPQLFKANGLEPPVEPVAGTPNGSHVHVEHDPNLKQGTRDCWRQEQSASASMWRVISTRAVSTFGQPAAMW